jgi:hypothetical protein
MLSCRRKSGWALGMTPKLGAGVRDPLLSRSNDPVFNDA